MKIIAFISIFVAAYFVFKTARDNGRNAWGWVAATIGTGIGLQVVIPTGVGAVIGFVWVVGGHPIEELISKFGGLLGIIDVVCTILSIAGIFMILRRVAQLPEENQSVIVIPPPPPTFGDNV